MSKKINPAIRKSIYLDWLKGIYPCYLAEMYEVDIKRVYYFIRVCKEVYEKVEKAKLS